MPRSTDRRHFLKAIAAAALAAPASAALPAAAQGRSARAILLAAYENWRADSSHAVITMTIRRAGRTRTLTLESWTSGRDKALVRFTAPPRDAGNATLQLGAATYVFNPKLNQVIKLPASAMSQSWMGSDFSYNDLARSQRVVDDYTHRIIGRRQVGGRPAVVIESVPKPRKPVVWGKQVIAVRDDGVLLKVEYFDRLGRRVRVLEADRIARLGGRPYPVVMTMRSDARPGQFTRITTRSAEFDIPLPSWLFTRSNLQNPRN